MNDWRLYLQVPEKESEDESDAEAHKPGQEQKRRVLIFGEKLQHN